MLNIIVIKGSKFVSLVEFYDYVFGDRPKYYRWVKYYVTENNAKMPIKGYDYLDLSEIEGFKQTKKGKFRRDYLISIDFLKQLCFDLKTNRCKQVREWAINNHSVSV